MRLPRYQIIKDNCFFHLTWQCHNKSFLLDDDWAKQLLYDLMLKYKDKYDVTIYSYCLMSNHPHIAGRMKLTSDFSKFMQVVHSQFARKFNKVNGRCGQLVMDRPKTPMIESERHLLTAMVYIDLNPVKAKMVQDPSLYKWSSYRYYAYGEYDPLITPCPSYLGLSNDPKKRCEIYRMMVEGIMKAKGYLRSKILSERCYIGNPDWVIKHYQILKEYLKSKRTKKEIKEKET